MNLSIRELRKEDIKDIEAIYALYWPDDEFRKKLGDKLKGFIKQDRDIQKQNPTYFVAEIDDEIVGVAGLRNVPEHMKEFSSTSNPCEFYILAVKHPGHGVGKVLVEKVIESAKSNGYTEIIMYSGETHNNAWRFYDRLGFERIADVSAPNGEPGKIWRMKL